MIRTCLLAFLLSVASNCLGAEFTTGTLPGGYRYIHVGGTFQLNDDLIFKLHVVRNRPQAVFFDSGGGNALAGIGMGRTAREFGLLTGVPPGSECASACALAWLGGKVRGMAPTSRIGFHAAYTRENGVAREVGSGNALVGAYLARLGLPDSAIALLTTAAPNEMLWLTSADAKALGAIVLDDPLEAGPSSPTRSVRGSSPGQLATRWHYVTGLDPNGDNWLALRSGIDTHSERLAKLPPETLLEVTEARDGWLRVKLVDGRGGWVSGRFVRCCR